jgi:flavodoxin
MRTLVVFYSRTGTTKKVARQISKILKCDTEELIDLKSRKGFKGFLSAGREGYLFKCAKIKKIKKDLSKYDLIILGTPVWSMRMSCAMRTFIKEYNSKFKKIACFMVYGGFGGYVNREMAWFSKKRPIAGMHVSMREVNQGKASKKVQEFCRTIRKHR